MLDHFLPRHFPWYQDGRTWSMVRAGKEVRSQTDYILGTDFCLFRKVVVRDPQHNLGRYLILGCLHSAPLRQNTDYLGRRTWLPLRPLTTPTR